MKQLIVEFLLKLLLSLEVRMIQILIGEKEFCKE